MRPSSTGSASGFTLVELILTMLVISIAVLAITNSLSFAFRNQSDGLRQMRALSVAQAYLQEIHAKRFDEATPVGGIPACSPSTSACSSIGPDGEGRGSFDDIDDYDGVDDQPPLDISGAPMEGVDGYRVQVEVSYLTGGQVAALGLDDATDGKLISVTVSEPGGDSLTFSQFRGNY